MSFEILRFGCQAADTRLFQMADGHDLDVMEQEIAYIRELSGEQDFCLTAVKVNDWNLDLSPWAAPAVFGEEDFGGGAAKTLEFLLGEGLAGAETPESPGKRTLIGGYSLAGLFALWAGFQTDRFDGVAAASPSIWFPHFTEYMRENRIQTGAVYLSLGDREARTRNPVMAQVGNAIRDAESILRDAGADCILEWNKGNHFKEPDLRMAKAFAWLMNREKK